MYYRLCTTTYKRPAELCRVGYGRGVDLGNGRTSIPSGNRYIIPVHIVHICTAYYFDVYICVQICEKAQFETLSNYQGCGRKMFECFHFCNLMMNALESFLFVYNITKFLVYNIKALQHQVAKIMAKENLKFI